MRSVSTLILVTLFSASVSAQTNIIGVNQSTNWDQVAVSPPTDALLLPFFMPENGRIESIQFRMARTALISTFTGGLPNLDGSVNVFISRAAPSPPNFTDELVGSTVQIPLSTPGQVSSTLVTSDFGNQFLSQGQYWLRVEFGAQPNPILGRWYAPVSLATGTPGTMYYHTLNQPGWTSVVDYPKFTVIYNNGTISFGGGSCSTSFSNPSLTATQPMGGQQTVQLRGTNPAGSPAALFFGFQLYPTPLSLSFLGGFGCNLYVDSLVALPGVTDANGWLDTQLTFVQPFVFYTQYAVAVPGENPLGVVLTNYGLTYTGDGQF